MKKFILASFFGILMLLTANTASAQLTFYNGTACPVKVYGKYTNSATPCTAGPYCTSGTILVPPFTSQVLPGGPCPFPGNSSFVKLACTFSGGPTAGTDACGGAPVPMVDCAGVLRTFQMFSFTFAAVY